MLVFASLANDVFVNASTHIGLMHLHKRLFQLACVCWFPHHLHVHLFPRIQPHIYLCQRVGISEVSLVHVTFLFRGTPTKNWFHWTDYKLSSNYGLRDLLASTSISPLQDPWWRWWRIEQGHWHGITMAPCAHCPEFFAHTPGWSPGEVTLPDSITHVPWMHLTFELS